MSRLLIVAALSSAIIAGCAPLTAYSTGSLSDETSFSGSLLTRARSKMETGRLAAALVDYKALSLLYPEDASIRGERAALEERIAAAVAVNSHAGQAALAHDRASEATRAFLAVLAVEPRNRAAFLALRNIETAKARRVQQRIGLDTIQAYKMEKERQRAADATTSPAAAKVAAAAPAAASALAAEAASETEKSLDAAFAQLQNARPAEALAALQSAAQTPETLIRAARLRASAHLEIARQSTAEGDLRRAATNLNAAEASNAAGGASLEEDISALRRQLAAA